MSADLKGRASGISKRKRYALGRETLSTHGPLRALPGPGVAKLAKQARHMDKRRHLLLHHTQQLLRVSDISPASGTFAQQPSRASRLRSLLISFKTFGCSAAPRCDCAGIAD